MTYYRRGHSRAPMQSSVRNNRASQRFKNDFDRDLAAMARVWSMIRQGAVRWIGEIGRQY
ncbi:hypothetical protein WB44_11085 [Synechococcus sp. WH 8020]|nr:hypothetical protein WB44_11085 [Synechococcus sp. WH 8020]